MKLLHVDLDIAHIRCNREPTVNFTRLNRIYKISVVV